MTSLKALAIALMVGAALLVGVTASGAAARTLELQDDPQLESEISDYLSGLDASYGVAAISLDDGRAVFVNADAAFPAASMYKLLVMYRVFQAIDQGSLSLDSPVTIHAADVAQEDSVDLSPGDTVTVADALSDMIAVSSNTAAWALTRTVGGWGVVSSAPDELGMSSTYLAGEDYWSTPDDLAHFFRLLANRSLVSPSASEQMIDLLLQQTANDRLPAYLPSGVEVAHKTGELAGVRNDGGIVRGFGGRYVIVVMSKGGDPAEQVPAEAEISRMVYDRYGG
jgi:beta-lactamase class A